MFHPHVYFANIFFKKMLFYKFFFWEETAVLQILPSRITKSHREPRKSPRSFGS